MLETIIHIIIKIFQSKTFWVAIGSLAGVIVAAVAVYSQFFSSEKRLRRRIVRAPHSAEIDSTIESFIDQQMRKYFHGYSDYIIIRYGSSVELGSTEIRDFDYLVLMLGYVENAERIKAQEGDSFQFKEAGVSVDIDYKDYYSFVFALIAGTPYEHSVLESAFLIRGNRGYLSWLTKLSQNIQIDRDYLIQSLKDRCIEYNKEIEDDLLSGCDFGTVVTLYAYVSAIIQIDCCSSFPPRIGADYVTPLAKSENLLSVLQEGELKDAYQGILRFYKREFTLPNNLIEKIRTIKTIVSKYVDF